MLVVAVSITTGAVSYTHLDVYKRQMSVAARSRSTAPNGNVPLMLEEIPEDDDLDLDF